MKHKETIVLLPALMCDKRLYQHQIETLKDRFNLVFPTIRHADNVRDAALYVLEMLDNNNIHSFNLVGTSMGGYIAMEIIHIYSHKVNKLCLINTSCDVDTHEKKQERLLNIKAAEAITDEQFIGINDNTLKQYLYNMTEENKNLVKDMVKDLGRQTFINQQKLILSRKSYLQDLKNYTLPILIVSSRYDTITPLSLHQEMYKNLKNGKLIVLDECNHLSPIDQKIALSAILDLWF